MFLLIDLSMVDKILMVLVLLHTQIASHKLDIISCSFRLSTQRKGKQNGDLLDNNTSLCTLTDALCGRVDESSNLKSQRLMEAL